MRVIFNKVHIHHFLSFNDSTIDLRDKGYCLVVGVNKNPKDAAKSNGSGKSTIWNAISYALVGETLNGLKSNLPNNFFNDGCYVELEFTVDNKKYKIIRSKDDKELGTNLKIYIDGEDKSGKGVRESQALLDQYLPDITIELLGSVIMLGQGLPQKFTSNSPSGRKEVLEHLSKSDFMIQDLKTRIDKRIGTLNDNLRTAQDTLLSIDSKKVVYKDNLSTMQQKLEQLQVVVDYDALIAQNTIKKINEIKTKQELTQKQTELNSNKDELSSLILKEGEVKQTRLDKIHKQYVDYHQDIAIRKSVAVSDKYKLTQEIQTLKEIKDICPTCGQRIPNVIKPDTTQQEAKLVEVGKLIESLDKESLDNDAEYSNAKNKINDLYYEATKDITEKLNKTKDCLNIITSNLSEVDKELSELEKQGVLLTTSKQNHEKDVKEVTENIKSIEKQLEDLIKQEEATSKKKLQVEKHLEVVNKMNTLIKRDFRGILLTNVIEFINQKAKEYCAKIFNTDAIEFKLDGNDLDIIYDNKEYENLSGGEKQRVDVIVQFAIRDMMSKYLDFSSNILVLDEITDALDSVSCDKVINFITEELRDVESVFIISHHASELEIPNDSEIIVEKNELGVSEVL